MHCLLLRPSRGEYGIPYCRRSGPFDVGPLSKLTFANAMHQLDAGNDDGSIAEPFETEHDVDP